MKDGNIPREKRAKNEYQQFSQNKEQLQEYYYNT